MVVSHLKTYMLTHSNTSNLFLFKQVRDVLGNTETAAKIGKDILESLPDKNKLKPTTWAQHKERKECFGVSLGVRPYVRSLFLYIKLSQLRRIEDNYTGGRLQDVNAFKHLMRMETDEDSNYEEPADACPSCKIFFDKDSSYPQYTRSQDGPPFGNCAEYDVIRTENLDYCLASPDVKILWDDVKSACIKQFKAFKELARKLDGPRRPWPPRNTMLQTYHTTTRAAKTKVLRYEWNLLQRDYRLIAVVWPR